MAVTSSAGMDTSTPKSLSTSLNNSIPRRSSSLDSTPSRSRSSDVMGKVDEPLKKTFQNMHNGYPRETLARFLKARDGNVTSAFNMLTDCLKWRIQTNIDEILTKPINPTELYRAVRESQLNGMSGYTKEGLPVFAVDVGRSTLDKVHIHYYVHSHIQMNEYRDRVILPSASKRFGRYIGTCIKILDMSGPKFSVLSRLPLLTLMSTFDDLNYPEKTETYYIVNAPYMFSACWKVVRPLLQERTRRKVQVLSGSGRDKLLKMMDYESLPHFCRGSGSGSSGHSGGETIDCFSLDHPFHQQLYKYIKDQAAQVGSIAPIRNASFHVELPEPDPGDIKIAHTINSEFQRLGKQNGVSRSLDELKINGD